VTSDDDDDLATLSRSDRLRGTILVVLLLAATLWISAHFLQPAPPRHIVLASGAPFGVYHQYAQRYIQILAGDGVTVEERATAGAAENSRLLQDPKSGVDVAFMQGGVVTPLEADGLEMLASLYYEPLWIFYRGTATLSGINELRGKRIAIGVRGSGTRAFVEPLLAYNAVTRDNSNLVSTGGN